MSTTEQILSTQQATVDGCDIQYVSAGSGPPVVLLHGWPTSSLLWRNQIPALAQSMRVYAPDLPGLGASPPLPRGHSSWDGQVEAVLGFLDALGTERVSLVGHDIGASIVLLTAIRHPERVERLVVLNTTPFPRTPWIIRVLVWAVKSPLVERLVTSRAGFHVLFRLGTRNPRTSLPELGRLYRGADSTPETRRAVREVLGGLDPDGLREIELGLDRVTCPALVLWGDGDMSAPIRIAQRLHQGLRHSYLRVIPGAGHFLPEDAPQDVTQHLQEFLHRDPAAIPTP